jgi:hypothetical protein
MNEKDFVHEKIPFENTLMVLKSIFSEGPLEVSLLDMYLSTFGFLNLKCTIVQLIDFLAESVINIHRRRGSEAVKYLEAAVYFMPRAFNYARITNEADGFLEYLEELQRKSSPFYRLQNGQVSDLVGLAEKKYLADIALNCLTVKR